MWNIVYCKFLFVLLIISTFYVPNECKRSLSSGRGGSRPSRPRPAPTHRPYTQAPTARPYTQAPTRAPTYRPYSQAPTNRPYPQAPTNRPYPQAPTNRPQPPPQPGRQPTYRPATQPGRYPTQPGRHPTQYPQGPPAYQSGGYSQSYVRPQQQSLQIPQPGGKTKVKVYNINNYHSPSYWAPPSYPMYHYSSRDTGSGVLGFFLGYSLAKITSPSYYHCHSCYSGYGPRYDHYTVHHYYHNSDGIPKEQKVPTNNIITCGDSSQICPANTVALCTATGQIMCVVAASSTVPCKDNANLKCAQSMIPCDNSDAAECKGVPKGQSTTVNIPCISNTIIEGNVTTVNNTIISTDPTNSTEVPIEITTLPNLDSNNTFPALGSNITQNRAKREAIQPYCVTILAEPSVRKPTEGETVFNEVTNVFEQFFSKAFGIGDTQKKN